MVFPRKITIDVTAGGESDGAYESTPGQQEEYVNENENPLHKV